MMNNKTNHQAIKKTIHHRMNISPCAQVRLIFNQPKKYCIETCLEIVPSYRFGNAMIQLLKAIQVAKISGMKQVYFHSGFLQLSQSFFINDINFTVINHNKHLNCFKNDFFVPLFHLPRVQFEIDNNFKIFFLNSFKKVYIPDDALVIHIRSGDIFKLKGKIEPFYGQPPCNYYRHIIHTRNWSRVILIAEDDNNPCVGMLSKEIGMNFVPQSLNSDLSVLLNAPNIAFGKGSFGIAISLFSTKLKHLFMFNQSSSRIPNHYNCIPTNEYYNSVITKWSNSAYQRNKVINSTCDKWEFIPKGSQNIHTFIHDIYI